MKSPSRSIIRYIGTAIAVLVPALVVAQTPVFSSGNVIRARDLQTLREQLDTARADIAALQSRVAASSLSKDRVEVREGVAPVAPGAIATASVDCDEPADIAVDCNCGGDNGPGTNGSTQLDQRIIQTQNPAGSTSQCDCVAQNVGTNVNARVIARVTCIVP